MTKFEQKQKLEASNYICNLFLKSMQKNRKFERVVFTTLGLLGFALFQACTTQQNANQKEYVVCTTNIIADVVKVVLPRDIKVISLMGEGVDPHLYKAGQKDLEYLQQAKVIVENGLHLEGKMAEVLIKLQRYKTVVRMSDGVDEAKLIKISDDIYDPHIWFDVQLWSNSVAHMAKEMTKVYPERSEEIRSNQKRFAARLESLNAVVKETMGNVDVNQRVLVTAHDAFSYFGKAYDTEVRGLQGISTQSEFGLKDVSDLVNYLVDRKIPAVFVETSVSEKSIRAVVEGCEKRGHQVNIGGKLYSDALGGKNEEGNTYINMVSTNVETIANALNTKGDE